MLVQDFQKSEDEEWWLGSIWLGFRDITRAYDIASEYSYKNIDYTLLHMSLTEALIVTNYIFNGINSRGRLIDLKTQQERAIDAYYRVFCEFGSVENQFEKKILRMLIDLSNI